MNKKENEKKGEQKKMVITTRTLVNGYELIVNEEGYMYFNVQSLLEGFMVHVGMKRLEEMTQEEIKDFLKATKDGSLNKKLQTEVNALKEERKELYFHQKLLNDELPLSIGGGIGQSRLCMVLLHKGHIGEIQASIWPDDMRAACKKLGMTLI